MRLFLDSANLTRLEPLLRTGVFYGVTTNPLILRESGLMAADLPAFTKATLKAEAQEEPGRCTFRPGARKPKTSTAVQNPSPA